MKLACLPALAAALVLAVSAAASARPSAGGAHYVFSFQKGLKRAQLGGTTSGYEALFRNAVKLPNIGSGICYGLAFAVGADAQKAGKPDLELYCGEKARIYETHFASSAFCSTGGTCVGTPGSLRKFAAELKGAAQAVQGADCISGGGTCSSLSAVFGLVNVAINSANCRTFASLTAIGPQCIASDVMIYRETFQRVTG
jgi:hypothetical protein